MKKIATIYERDVFPDRVQQENVEYQIRKTGKAIVLNDKNEIALVGNKENDFLQLPGGGIDDGEDLQDGVIRECLEEIGYPVNIVDEVGIIEDYRPRDGKHCINYCYIAQVAGEKVSYGHTEDEASIGMYIKWVEVKEALEIFKRQKVDLDNGKVSFYNTGFNILRNLKFLEEAVSEDKVNG